MILYPLNQLKRTGITDILIISGGNHIGGIAEFLGDGSKYGVSLTYKVQNEAGGIAQAIGLAKDFTKGEKFVVILGDNFFADELRISDIHTPNPTIFIKKVKDPNRFGVYDSKNKKIIEKPKKFISDLVVTGIYVYDSEVFDFIESLKPSKRGEMEITSVNNWYLKRGKMSIHTLNRFWSDMGTPESLANTAKYVIMCENIRKKAIGRIAWNKGVPCPEEIKVKIGRKNIGKVYPTEINKKKGFPKETNPNWKGGISKEENIIRTSREYEEWRKSVFERDGYKCVIGGIAHGNKLNADHIKSFSLHPELRLDVKNGRTLCEECHRKTETYGSKSRKTKTNINT